MAISQRAIAAYERTQVAFDTPFDRFMAGDNKAISESRQTRMGDLQRQGPLHVMPWMESDAADVQRLQCFTISACRPINPTSCRWRARPWPFWPRAAAPATRRLAIQTDMSGLGRFLVTKQPHDIGGFRTMGLRNLLVTQPYFHDGSQQTRCGTSSIITTRAASRIPSSTAASCPSVSAKPKIDDLVAFLATLTSPEYQQMAQGRVRPAVQALPHQSAAARHRRGDGA